MMMMMMMTGAFAVTGRHLTRAKVAERKTPACRSGNRSWRPRRARFIALLVTTATARAVHSQAPLHHFAAAAHTHNKLQRSPTDPRDALRCVRRVVHTLGLLVGWLE